LRGPNPIRFRDSLLALFRFDEAAGTILHNTASFEQETTPTTFVDSTRTVFEWVNYK
jgi:hypothetical protein